MILSQYGFNTVLSQLNHASFDPSRIASQVVTGIGFIGAGTIIFQKHVVRGLTTAAGLWVTSAIGMTCGTGMYLLAIAATVMVLICLEALNLALHKIGTRSISVTFSSPSRENVKAVLLRMKDEGAEVDSYDMQEKRSSGGEIYLVTMEVKVKRDKYEARILDFMSEFDGVTIENIE
jgi:putative Mg2+ transporter-C (MgtC) family protein